MDEYKLCEEIKNNFKIEKGRALLIRLTSDKISELNLEFFTHRTPFCGQILEYVTQYLPFAFFDYVSEDRLIFNFKGTVFKITEDLTAGGILSYDFYGKRKPVTLEDVHKDLTKLRSLFRNKKIS